jgi:hypothetical protein
MSRHLHDRPQLLGALSPIQASLLGTEISPELITCFRYFLAVTMYYLYGETVIYYFKHVLLVDKVLLPFATHHRFIR